MKVGVEESVADLIGCDSESEGDGDKLLVAEDSGVALFVMESLGVSVSEGASENDSVIEWATLEIETERVAERPAVAVAVMDTDGEILWSGDGLLLKESVPRDGVSSDESVPVPVTEFNEEDLASVVESEIVNELDLLHVCTSALRESVSDSVKEPSADTVGELLSVSDLGDVNVAEKLWLRDSVSVVLLLMVSVNDSSCVSDKYECVDVDVTSSDSEKDDVFVTDGFVKVCLVNVLFGVRESVPNVTVGVGVTVTNAEAVCDGVAVSGLVSENVLDTVVVSDGRDGLICSETVSDFDEKSDVLLVGTTVDELVFVSVDVSVFVVSKESESEGEPDLDTDFVRESCHEPENVLVGCGVSVGVCDFTSTTL